MSFHWKTANMIAVLQAACPGLPVSNIGPGGDYDTDELLVEVHNHGTHVDAIRVTGYSPGSVVSNPSDHVVTHMELCDGQDSSGGLVSSDPAMVDAYCNVRKALATLLAGTGVSVYRHYHEFF